MKAFLNLEFSKALNWLWIIWLSAYTSSEAKINTNKSPNLFWREAFNLICNKLPGIKLFSFRHKRKMYFSTPQKENSNCTFKNFAVLFFG